MRLRGWKIGCGNPRKAGNEYSFIITAISEFYFRCQKIKHPQLNIKHIYCHTYFLSHRCVKTQSYVDAVASLIMSRLNFFSKMNTFFAFLRF